MTKVCLSTKHVLVSYAIFLDALYTFRLEPERIRIRSLESEPDLDPVLPDRGIFPDIRSRLRSRLQGSGSGSVQALIQTARGSSEVLTESSVLLRT